MPLFINTTAFGPDSFFVEDDGIPGNAIGRLRGGFGNFAFAYPADSISITAASGQIFTLNLLDPLGPCSFTLGSLTSASESPDQIKLRRMQSDSTVTLVATQNITESGTDPDADVVAGTLLLSAATGIASTGNAIEIQTSILEAETTTGGINLHNNGSVTIGGASGSADINGLEVLTSGHLVLDVLGSIVLADNTGLQTIKGGDTSGNVTLTASGSGANILSTVDGDAISAPGGRITLTAAGNVQFGTGGSDFDNDVRAKDSITIEAGGQVWIDGFSDIASDDFGAGTGGGVTINAGAGILLLQVLGNDGSILAGGSAGADVVLSAGAGSIVQLTAPSAGAVSSSSGDVIVNGDRIQIAIDSGIAASQGQVILRPQTEGRAILLGGTNDSSLNLELSDAELDRVTAPSLTVGGATAGAVTVTAAISPLSVPDLTIQSGSDIVVNGAATIAVTGKLQLRAGDDLFLVAGSGLFAGDGFTGFVDFGNTDAGTGGTAFADVSFAVKFVGNADKDSLTGGGGDDTLDGAANGDTLTGRGGNDTYLVDDSGDTTVENAGEGTDLVQASVSHTLQANVENLTLTGNANLNGNGNTLDNVLTGNTGDNTLNGSTGQDTLFGNNGNDTLIGGTGDDILNGGKNDDILNGQGGIDTASYDGAAAAVTVSIIAGAQNTGGSGMDTLVGIENLTGSKFNDVLTGDNADNVLRGGIGTDTLVGGGGSDSLFGDNSADTLVGGAGRDSLTGGASGDTFDFNDVSESGTTGATRDQILDFVQGSDRIDLATIDANTLVGGDQAFSFIGASGFSAAGQLRAIQNASNTLISGDINGDGAADFGIQINGLFTLTAGDFVL